MAISGRNPQVTKRIESAKAWNAELGELRELFLDEGLAETVKWSKPTFTIDGSIVAFIAGMKETVAIAFLKGVLLRDPEHILAAPGPNSRTIRWAKFKSLAEIEKHAATLKSYIREAVDLERSGARVDMKANDTLKPPPEFKRKLASDAKFKKAFQSLTPGRQRAYILHFAGAKQSATRESRIARHEKRILAGKGILD